jgi:chromosome segregation ATPase
MTDATTVLALMAELERVDREQAADLAVVDALVRRIDDLRSRVADVRTSLDRLPDELTRLDQAEAEARERLERANADLAVAERRLAELESAGKGPSEAVDTARRVVARDAAAASDARVAVERLAARREELRAEERRARGEATALEQEAPSLAAELREAPRVSATNVAEPAGGLDGLDAWAERAHAALFVARAGLERARELTVREAVELGASALGEDVGPAGVSVIRRRLERALRST